MDETQQKLWLQADVRFRVLEVAFRGMLAAIQELSPPAHRAAIGKIQEALTDGPVDPLPTREAIEWYAQHSRNLVRALGA